MDKRQQRNNPKRRRQSVFRDIPGKSGTQPIKTRMVNGADHPVFQQMHSPQQILRVGKSRQAQLRREMLRATADVVIFLFQSPTAPPVGGAVFMHFR